jgi:two-component system, chemotaxis family, protein-glutamate methylesterase/glutaminase
MPPGEKIRVLVVDDSAFMRKVLVNIINSDAQMEVVGQAKDGREAIEMCESLHPDVLTMDINMPRIDGLQATELIMAQNPRPIVIVSSESREGTASTLRALELGAIDFVPKPSSGIDLDMNQIGHDLNRKLKMAAKVRVIRTATRAKVDHATATPARSSRDSRNSDSSGGRFPMVVIAASTGGPATLMRLVPRFPKGWPGAIFLVQHMPAAFTAQYAAQLAEAAEIRVKEAEANESIQPGTVYVCPGSHHLRISPTGTVQLDDGPRIAGYRPCADVAFESLAANAGKMAIAIVLTGMGNDGAQGAKAVKAAGGCVIAQDETSAVIFGMPAEAIKTGAVEEILPIDEIFKAVDRRAAALTRPVPVSVR